MQAAEEVSRIDASSGQSLEEVTAMVEATNSRIKGRKDVLAPKIKELRAARAHMADLTATHEEARAAFQKVQDTHDSRLEELEGQVASLQAAVDEVWRLVLEQLFRVMLQCGGGCERMRTTVSGMVMHVATCLDGCRGEVSESTALCWGVPWGACVRVC